MSDFFRSPWDFGEPRPVGHAANKALQGLHKQSWGLSQKLILTPSLQQAIKLLPMTTLELVDMLNQEVVENPMLEEIPEEELQQSETTSPAEKPEDPPADAEKQDSWDDADYKYFFGDYLDDENGASAPRAVMELSTRSSLSDHLTWQLSLQTKNDDPLVREIGSAIIGNLDDDGYLVASFEEIAAMGSWSLSEIERVLQVVQGFDPIGVAARGLQECLLLQLDHLGLSGTGSETIVREHLKLLQNHQGQEIARRSGMSVEELKHHIDVIRQLDPKPGSRHNPTSSQFVIPDVHVVKVEDRYVVVLNEDGMPQLRISPVYRRLLDKKNQNSEETRAYVREKFRSALWLIKSVDQRQKTIFKVATSIITFQTEFLDRGIEYLRPLVLRDVANDIGILSRSQVRTNRENSSHYSDKP